MAELAYQTYERITGKPWATAKANGLTDGSASANLALQKKLLSGWNPYAQSAPQAAASAPAAPVANEDQKQRDYLNSAEYANKIDAQVRALYDPELKNIDIEKDMYNQEIEDAIKEFKKEELRRQADYLQKQGQYGILRSTITDTGLQDMNEKATTTLNRYEANRANRLAQFALQKAAIESKITSQKTSIIDQAKQEFEKAILQRDQEAFNRAMQMAKLAADMEEGTQIDLGEFGIIKGTKKVKATSSSGGGSSKATSGSTASKTNQRQALVNELSVAKNKYASMSWGDFVNEAKSMGADPVYFRDWIYQQALSDPDYAKLSASEKKSIVYGIFGDNWR